MNLTSVGLLLPIDPSDVGVRNVIDLGVAGEDSGFDSLWFGDHIRWHTPVTDPLIMLGALARATSTAHLGTAVLLAGLRHPVAVANALATLDHLSDGRVIAGFGAGTDVGGDFAAVGADASQRGKLVEEAIPAIRTLLRGEAFQAAARAWSADAAPGLPSKQSTLPLLLGGHADVVLNRAARLTDGWITAFAAPKSVGEQVLRLGLHLDAAGRAREEFSVLAVVYVHLAATKDAAEKAADAHFRPYYRQPASRFAAASAFGPLDLLHDRLSEYRDAGVDGVILAQPVPDERSLSQIASVASSVFDGAIR